MGCYTIVEMNYRILGWLMMMFMSSVMMMMSSGFFHVRLGSVNYIKICHHTCSMVFEYMTVVHPGSRPVIRRPRDLDLCPRLQIISVLPRQVRRSLPILFNHLEKETM